MELHLDIVECNIVNGLFKNLYDPTLACFYWTVYIENRLKAMNGLWFQVLLFFFQSFSFKFFVHVTFLCLLCPAKENIEIRKNTFKKNKI